MTVATEFFTKPEVAAIEAAVTAAESTTTAEIVPVVATVSGRYDRAESTFGLLFALGCLLIFWLFFQDIQPVQANWAPGYELRIDLIAILLIVVVGYIAGLLLANYVPVLRRPFVGQGEMAAEVAEVLWPPSINSGYTGQWRVPVWSFTSPFTNGWYRFWVMS